MKLPATNPLPVLLPAARLVRIAVAGVLFAAIVLGVGLALEWTRLGRDDAVARRKVEAEVRAEFDTMARSLRSMATPLTDAPSLGAAADGDEEAARRLFDDAEQVVLQTAVGGADELTTSDVAVTAYSAAGLPVAWGGSPSQLPGDRVQGTEAWFFAQGAVGLRLVYLTPVSIPADGRRVGAVAAERALASSPDVPPAGEYVAPGFSSAFAFEFPTTTVPVTIYPTFQDAPARPGEFAFEVSSPAGGRLLTAVVAQEDLASARQQWQRATLSLALIALAVVIVLLAGPLLDWRNHARSAGPFVMSTLFMAALAMMGRLLLRIASPADWSTAPVFSASTYASARLRPLLTSPFDFLLTAVTAGSIVALAWFAVEAWRLALWRRRRKVDSRSRRIAYVAAQLAAGGLVAALLVGYHSFLRDTIANTGLDLLHLSVHPWDSARLALQVGLVVWHATALATAVLLLRTALVPWRLARRNWPRRLFTVALWTAPLAGWLVALRIPLTEELPLLGAAAAAALAALLATRIKARYRHGSQAFRLAMLTAGFVFPAIAFYPALFQLAWRAKTELVETRYAPQAIKQRQTIQLLLSQSLAQIDEFPGLAEFVAAGDVVPAGTPVPIDRAFQVWRITSLATYPMTSSVELYAADGVLASRFAFNLPEDLTATTQRFQESTCEWELYEEVSPFFAEERRVLHAGRAICVPDAAGRGVSLGSIVVHAMLDYGNLPFIASQSPYVELLRPEDPLRGEGVSGGDVEYAVYGWSRTPLYASGDTAWPLDDVVFASVAASRDPRWAELRRGDDRFDVYLLNDRGGIYALGFPVVSSLGHLVNLAEVTVLGFGTYLLLLTLNIAFAAFSRRRTSAPALLRELRASFYRKLFIAFLLAAVVPVVALAILTSAYVEGQMRANVESEAVRTASAARRVVEDLVAPRAAQQGVAVDDNLMVWVSRLIDQDANIFDGSRLLATSERNLFASGLLPIRTPSELYRALVLRREASAVTRERIGELEYMVAATAVSARRPNTILTVPLTSRQQEIEREIDALDRRVLLLSLLFIFGGAGLGYYMAERVADPVNRLTRATRRIARGDLDARVTATSSDELRRLVDDFNKMAMDLQRQRRELERTHRLEAWAEMARQVAHEIKNPLTPIQLNAEHLRRVHADRGHPLSPVLEECVGTILQQVKLLRQIASEFSSFASSPTAKFTDVDVAQLLDEILAPYRSGLSDRIRFHVDVPADLAPVRVDRTLVSRALTNIVENALHAMPSQGTLTVVGQDGNGSVRLRVSDTGAGMDPEALARAFEPYFSTKAAGTGLGLPIAKRNVELNGGTIGIVSERDRGTTVEITLPAVPQPVPSVGAGGTPSR